MLNAEADVLKLRQCIPEQVTHVVEPYTYTYEVDTGEVDDEGLPIMETKEVHEEGYTHTQDISLESGIGLLA